ncbi:IgGFc-binding protein [Myxococcota bacterium]|nr:IgGFc-binding protein [Myxococcota bacterium]MBU1413790.1 IgGFc-binding protein [Myxococcota bacterium]MBU1512350.1 IgGFc-binding protein [Myxococcota bacterium]
MRITFMLLFVVLFAAGCECSRDDKTNNTNAQNSQNLNNPVCTEGDKKCELNMVQLCENGQWRIFKECGQGELTGPLCDPVMLECVYCYSGGTACQPDGHVYYCLPDGHIGEKKEDCDLEYEEDCIEWSPGEAVCGTDCNIARLSRSYLGCDLVATVTANASLRPPFADNFGVALDNAGDRDATVYIEGPDGTRTEDLPAHTLRVILLPFHEPLRTGSSLDSGLTLRSGQYTAAAYRLTTTQPVTAYQFNPYDFVLDVTGIDYYSYTNDASLLLPVSSLGQGYTAMSRPTNAYDTVLPPLSQKHSPGFVTVVAVENNTAVTVRSTAHTAAGDGLETMAPGDERTFVLQKNDVLQLVTAQDITAGQCPETPGSATESDQRFLYCNPGADYDLTGTRVTSDKPVAVWSGHNCSFVPYQTWACDHLEEMLFPHETWGQRFVIGFTAPVETATGETNAVRVVAAEDDTVVTFSPDTIAAPRTLAAGEWVEVIPPPQQHFGITADKPVLVARFMVGQNYWTTAQDASGDPSMGLVVPVEQFRDEYRFTTPPSFPASWVNIIVPADMLSGDTLTLDQTTVLTLADFTVIGDTGFALAQLPLTAGIPAGSHHLVASRESLRFGIEVYGFANYTSYLYPGGLDLYQINTIDK